MLDERTGGRAAQLDRDGLGDTRADVVAPDAEVALERDRLAVVRDGGPEHATIGELRELPLGSAAHGTRPQVRRAASVAHEVERLAVGGNIGHSFFDPEAVSCSYFGTPFTPGAMPCTSQISLSSM